MRDLGTMDINTSAQFAADPFTVHRIAVYDITEAAFTTVAPGFENLKA